MKYSLDCLPCLLQLGVRNARRHFETDEEQRSLVRKLVAEIALLDDNVSAPCIAQRMQKTLKEVLQNPDPYRQEKDYYNQEMLNLEAEFLQLVESADNPLSVALKLAAAGNFIDFAPGYDLSKDNVLKTIDETMKKEYSQEVFDLLDSALREAQTLLYLGDNAGEIVFDKIFIRVIKTCYPDLQIYFAVRGEPVLNDVTEEDAYFVGIDAYADIISNGTDIPGTVIEHCSDSFVSVFRKADVIISKGQGNFESLYGTGRDNIYYIFLCKCGLFMERFGIPKNDLVLLKD